MLGRKDYTREEYEHGKSAVEKQLTVYKKLTKTIASDASDKKLQSALEDFEGCF